MKPKISVIVPIYNTEKYLEKCLDSLVNQSMKDIEIICVDDSSPDNSLRIIEKFSREDPRIKVIKHEKNLGLGGARNSGILAAKSEYIASVDSDDTINENMLEELWEATEEGVKDIICCGYNELSEGGKLLHQRNFEQADISSSDSSIDFFNTFNPSFCNKLWRRSLFVENSIFFPENRYFEDTATTPRVLMKAKRIKIIDKSLYNYYQRDQSITSTFTDQHISDLFHAYDIVLESLIENKLLNHYKTSLVEYIESGFRFHYQGAASANMPQNEIDQYLELLLKNKLFFLENKLSYFGEKKHYLTVFQKQGSKLFEILFGVFVSPTHLKKLKHHPEYFFRDSKNKFTRFIGRLLRIV